MNLLFINACVRGEKSRTLELARFYINSYIEKHPGDWFVTELDLNSLDVKIQDRDELDRRESLMKSAAWDDPMFDLAKQFMSADYIVIGAPYWDLQFPALLKIYLERISVSDLTFVYDEHGVPHGQCRAKEAAYVMTAGGYTGIPTADGHIESMNYGYEYVYGLFTNLFSFEDVKLIKAEGLDIVGNDYRAILDDTMRAIQEEKSEK